MVEMLQELVQSTSWEELSRHLKASFDVLASNAISPDQNAFLPWVYVAKTNSYLFMHKDLFEACMEVLTPPEEEIQVRPTAYKRSNLHQVRALLFHITFLYL